MTKRALLLLLAAAGLPAQVTFDRILHAANEPRNWLTYSGSYGSQHYSLLNQITPANVKNLELEWVWQANIVAKLEATPLVVDGVMYLTEAPSDVIAVDAKTGHVFWVYQYRTPPDVLLCCGQVNRGVAMLGSTLFVGTEDAHLVALDAKSGRPVWDTVVADYKAGYGITHAPLVVKDKVIVGTAGGEYGIRGIIAAYDAATGKQAWKFDIIPGPGQPGHETWRAGDWQHGGGSAWMTGSYDPDLNLIYWGTGNPGPDWDPDDRPGDNLYTDCALALDADTGKLKWHFQFTPHDGGDWDAVQVPVLVNRDWDGKPRKLLMWANRNGFFYVLDRETGKFIRGNAFVKQNWAKGLDDSGRPVVVTPSMTPTPEGMLTYPGVQGGTNWYPPSYSPRTGLFYIPAWEDYSTKYVKAPVQYSEGQRFTGGRPMTSLPSLRRGWINTWTEEAGHGEVLAIDPRTGERKWSFKMHDVTDSGLLTTASDLLFTGGREGYFYAFDARNGTMLWKANVGGQISAAPMTYEVDGRQYVAVAAGHCLFVYAIRGGR
jgi:alcohol dehydrogenase (cytochrome c)